MRKFTIGLVLFCLCFTLTVYGQKKVNDEFKDQRFYQKIEKLNRIVPQSHQFHKMMDQHLLLDSYVRQNYYEDDWENNLRTEFSYENGMRTEERVFRYNEGTGWENDFRSLYVFDGNLVTETVVQYWSSQLNDWVNYNQQLYSYQEVNNTQVLSNLMLNEWQNNEWKPEINIDVDFTGGTFNSFTSFWWNSGTNEWIPEYRSILNEDAGDLYITEDEWDGGDWMPDYRTIYHGLTKNSFYDQIMKEIDLSYYGSWLYFIYLVEFPEFTEQYWDGADWVNDWRMRHEASAAKSSASSTFQYVFEFYSEGSGWMVDEIYEYEIGTSGLLEKATEYYLDWEGVVSPGYSEDFLYNSNTNHLETINQFEIFDGSSELDGRILFEWTTATSLTDNLQRPEGFQLGNAYPNPFNPSTIIPYKMATTAHANIRIYDMLGRQVAILVDEVIPAGEHNIRFDAGGLSSGVYIVRFETAGAQHIRKITLLK